jgi:cephalosporin hydroxylase
VSREDEFCMEVSRNIESLARDRELRRRSLEWTVDAARHRYSYNFRWMGRPIIQYPQDMVVMQELIWDVRPDLIIETGVAHGGSLVFYASLLELMGGRGRVLGIDIDIKQHNRAAVETHPMAKRIDLLVGSSIDPKVVGYAIEAARGAPNVMVLLDSNHSHEHVLAELRQYAPLVTVGSYLVVFDTIVQYFPVGYFHDRPWDKDNNPMTAVQQFLKETDMFAVDETIDAKIQISVAPGGYLRRVR